MGARWARGTLEDRANRMENVAISSIVLVRKVMEDIAREGAQTMQDNIEKRGTEYSAWRAAHGRGTSGRHDTGTMVDAVEYRVDSPVSTVVNAEIGWLDDFLEYFGLQEKGFWNVWAQAYTPGMFALRDAGDEMRDRLKEAGPEIIAEIAKRLGK